MAGAIASARPIGTVETASVITGQVLAALGGLVMIRLLTGALTPAEYGAFALAWTLITFSQQLAAGPLTQALSRFYVLSPGKALLKPALLLSRWYGLLLAAVCALAAAVIAATRPAFLPLVIAAAVFAFSGGVNATLDAVYIAARWRTAAAIHQSLTQWLRVACLACFIRYSALSATSALFALSMGTALVLVSQIAILIHRHRSDISLAGSPVTYQDLQRYARPFLQWGVLTWLHLSSDRWALAIAHDRSAAGYYNAIYYVGYYPALLAGSAFLQLVTPFLFQVFGDGSDRLRRERATRYIRQFAAIGAVITVAGTVLLWLSHPWIARMFLGARFQAASYLLPLAFAASAIFSIGQLIGTIQVVNLHPEHLLPIKVFTSAAGIAGNVCGAIMAGPLGVFVACALTAMLYCALVMWINRSALL